MWVLQGIAVFGCVCLVGMVAVLFACVCDYLKGKIYGPEENNEG